MTVKESSSEGDAVGVVPRARSFLLPGGRVGILLLHGFTGSIDTLRPLGAFLAGHGYTVLGARLAGHGGTEEALERSTRNDWRRSAAQAYAELRTRVDRVVAIGDSLGSILALELTLAHPDILAVVVLNPPLRPRHANRNRLVLPFLRRLRRFQAKPWVSAERRAEHLARGSAVRVPLAAYTEFLRVAAEMRRLVPRITVPFLVVQSRLDPTVDPKGGAELAARAGSSIREIRWLDESVHHVVDAQDRARVFADILGFVLQNAPLPTSGPRGSVGGA